MADFGDGAGDLHGAISSTLDVAGNFLGGGVHGQFVRGRAGGFVVAGCAAQEWPPNGAELASGALLSRLEHVEIRFELLRQWKCASCPSVCLDWKLSAL